MNNSAKTTNNISRKVAESERFKNIINHKLSYGTIITIIIIILVTLYIIYTVKNFMYYKKSSPYLIEYTIDASNNPMVIPANKILDSIDSQYGTEFTYSFWIYISDSNYANNNGINKHIFNKGSNDYSITNNGSNVSGSYPLLQSPGVWLDSTDNKLIIQFNTYNNIIENATIGNIPLNKWVNISIILIGNSVDVYVNCNLKRRVNLSGVPKLNAGNLYIANWNGFNGYISKFRYYNYALKPFQLDQICSIFSPATVAPVQSLASSSSYLSPNYWMTTGYPNSVGISQTNSNNIPQYLNK